MAATARMKYISNKVHTLARRSLVEDHYDEYLDKLNAEREESGLSITTCVYRVSKDLALKYPDEYAVHLGEAKTIVYAMENYKSGDR